MYSYQIFFLVMRTFKIYSLNNFQICNAVLLTIVCACVLRHVRLFVIPMDCSPTGSSVHRIFQAKILEWVVISYSRTSSQPRDRNMSLGSPALAGRFFTTTNNLREIPSRIFPSQMLHIIIVFIFLHSLFLSQTSEN